MADTIPGQQTINIGIQNESTGSDSLYDAFNKTKTNFAILFGNASPFDTFSNGVGITTTSDANTGTVTITNTGVLSLTPADSSIVIAESTPGNLTIAAVGGGNGGGTVTYVGVQPASSSRITVSGSPIISNGNITLDLATSGVTAGTYTYPTVTVDNYGRITTIANANSVGTVTSVGVNPGTGIQVTGSPVTSNGTMTITNTGVTRLNAGTGILLSGANGNVTVSASLTGGTVTTVGVSSSTLSISGSPITTTGIISIDLPTTISVSGNVTGANLNTTGSVLSNGTAGIGYGAGAGGTVVQTTSRTTGVTINKTSGSIQLYSAAGTSAYTTFTVTNSRVAATDVIIINQKSGTDKYEAWISNVAAGSFDITFADMSGTTTEQPVFNFAVIKAVAA